MAKPIQGETGLNQLERELLLKDYGNLIDINKQILLSSEKEIKFNNFLQYASIFLAFQQTGLVVMATDTIFNSVTDKDVFFLFYSKDAYLT